MKQNQIFLFCGICAETFAETFSHAELRSKRARAPGREARIYVSGCESMDLNETDLGHQAVLSDHAWFGWYGQVRTAACSTVE